MSERADVSGALPPPPPQEPEAPTPIRRQRRGTKESADNRAGLLLISPTVIIVVVMVILPILWTVFMAFQRIRLLNISTAGLAGDYTLDNFRGVFSSEGFWSSLLTTLTYSVLGTAGAIGLGLVAALALRRPFRGRGLVRALMLLPYVAPVVSATFAWTTMANPQFGIINYWGQKLLGWDEPIAFFSDGSGVIPVALLSVIVFETWRSFPFAFLFLTARLAAAPATLEEAALVDGATPTQTFRYVVLPQLMPTIAVLTVLRFIWTFNSFDDIYLLTGGGAGTEVISVRVFNALTARGDVGAAASQALVLALILGALVILYLRRFAKREEVV